MKFLVAVLSIAMTGCATFEVAGNVRPGSPRFLGGMQLDIAAMASDWKTLDHFKAYGMQPPAYPAADLPFSIALDFAVLPFQIGYSIIQEPLFDPR